MVSPSNPGQVTGRTISYRSCLMSEKNLIVGRGILDASKSYDGKNTGYEYDIRPGTPMGLIAATGLWVPCRRTKLSTGNTGTTTTIVVDDARAFMVGDVISVGADTTITVTAINYGTNTLTIASTAVVDGEAVIVADGSATCRGILNEFVSGLDPDGQLRDKQISVIVMAGYVDYSAILGDIATIRAASGMYLNHIVWSDQQGQT